MGWSLSWLALEHADAALAADRLGLEVSPERADPGRAPLVGCALPGGWYLLVANRCDDALVSDAIARLASRDRAAVAVSLEEHVMVCVAALWSSGERRWRVSHREREDDDPPLRIAGAPSATLEALAARARAEEAHAEAEGDPFDAFFDVPLELARELTGFKHDDWPDALEGTFTVLRPLPGGPLGAARRPWWRFW